MQTRFFATLLIVAIDLSAVMGAIDHARVAHGASRPSTQSTAFSQAMPWVPVVRSAHVRRFLFRSNPAEVERALEDFLAKMPRQ